MIVLRQGHSAGAMGGSQLAGMPRTHQHIHWAAHKGWGSTGVLLEPVMDAKGCPVISNPWNVHPARVTRDIP